MEKYGDMLDMERPRSKWFTPMDTDMRAAQFAPFEALIGLEETMDDDYDD